MVGLAWQGAGAAIGVGRCAFPCVPTEGSFTGVWGFSHASMRGPGHTVARLFFFYLKTVHGKKKKLKEEGQSCELSSLDAPGRWGLSFQSILTHRTGSCPPCTPVVALASEAEGISCWGKERHVISPHPLLNISCSSRRNAQFNKRREVGELVPGPLRCAAGGWQRLRPGAQGHLGRWAGALSVLVPLLSYCVASGRLFTLSELLFVICKIWGRTRHSACCEAHHSQMCVKLEPCLPVASARAQSCTAGP